MSRMTTLPRSRPLTRADLDAMPDDGHRYELIDGVLLVTPAPVTRHQRASFQLGLALHRSLPPGLEILHAPRVVDPDVPSIIAWHLVDGRYAEAGGAEGTDVLVLDVPHPLTIGPADLVR